MPLSSDITDYKCSVKCFEISSTGFINKRNHLTLNILLKFMRHDLKKSTLKNNINALAWYGSYKIWQTRNEPEFMAPPYLIAHL